METEFTPASLKEARERWQHTRKVLTNDAKACDKLERYWFMDNAGFWCLAIGEKPYRYLFQFRKRDNKYVYVEQINVEKII